MDRKNLDRVDFQAIRGISMKRLVVLGLCAAVFIVQASWSVYTQTAKPPGPLRTERVKGDLYMVSGEGGNVALYTTSEGVVLVDDMFHRHHADILAQIKSVTDQPLRYVINTLTQNHSEERCHR